MIILIIIIIIIVITCVHVFCRYACWYIIRNIIDSVCAAASHVGSAAAPASLALAELVSVVPNFTQP
jgi:hypothetical protein